MSALRSLAGLFLVLGSLPSLELTAAENAVHRPAPIPLFNGKDLTGWVAEGTTEVTKNGEKLPIWSVVDGNLTCAGSGFGFLRYDQQQFSDFSLHVEYRLAKNGNSGLGIRTTAFDLKKSKDTRPSFYSYEIQLLDDATKPAGTHSTGSLYRYVAPRVNAVKPSPEWNVMDVTCVGPKITIELNGEQIVDVDQSTREELKAKPLQGFISLQNHGSKVEFRAVSIMDLTPAPPGTAK